jgi:hypothetical protein
VASVGTATAVLLTIDAPATVGEQAVRVTLPPTSGVIYTSAFTGANGSAWPAPWTPLNSAVLSSTIVGNEARLTGEMAHVARMALPTEPAVDAEAEFTIRFDDYHSQGFGFYLRQNGGALRDTAVHGQGYAVFVEGGYQRVVGLWSEIDGVETRIAASTPNTFDLVDGQQYRVRFRVEQAGTATSVRAKVWPIGSAEPAGWSIETLDATPQLQNVSGRYAADVYNYAGTGGVNLDDLTIRRL